MGKILYKTQRKAPGSLGEPVLAYQSTLIEEVLSSNSWNPNIPFHGTQEEWWGHFSRIEKGPFFTIEEADEEFEVWKKGLLANRM